MGVWAATAALALGLRRACLPVFPAAVRGTVPVAMGLKSSDREICRDYLLEPADAAVENGPVNCSYVIPRISFCNYGAPPRARMSPAFSPLPSRRACKT